MTISNAHSPVPAPARRGSHQTVAGRAALALKDTQRDALLLGGILGSFFIDTSLLSGIEVRLFDVLFVVFLAHITLRGRNWLRFDALAAPELALFMICGLFGLASSLFVNSLKATAVDGAQLLEYTFFVMTLVCVLNNPRSMQSFMNGFAVVVGGLAVWAVIHAAMQGDILRGYKEGDFKLTFGIFALINLVMCMAPFERKQMWFYLMPVSLLGLLLSGERKTWLGFMVAAAAAGLAYGLLRKRVGGVAVVSLAIGLLAIAVYSIIPELLGSTYISKQISTFEQITAITSIGDSITTTELQGISNNVRLYLAHIATDLMEQNPWFGVGTSKFIDYTRVYGDKTLMLSTHNEYLRVGAENGIPALVLYCSTFLVMIWRAFSLCRRPHVTQVPYASTMVLFSVGLTVFATIVIAFLAVGARTLYFPLLSIGMLIATREYITAYQRKNPAQAVRHLARGKAARVSRLSKSFAK